MAYSLLFHKQANMSGPSTAGSTAAVDTTGVNAIYLIVTGYQGQAAVSDSYSNTWTGQTGFGAQDPKARIYRCVNPTVGAGHTFTVSQGASNGYGALVMLAFSGADTASNFDTETFNTNAFDNTNNRAPGSLTPANDNELIITAVSAVATGGGNATINDANFTIIESIPESGGVNIDLAVAYSIQTTKATVNPTWTVAAGGDMATGMSAHNAAAGGAPSAPVGKLLEKNQSVNRASTY